MTRPETARDVFDVVRQSGLVAESHLVPFLDRVLAETAAPDGALTEMVAAGLLTRFQAEEVAAGRVRGLWLGGYRVLDPVGTGGMSQVFLAEHAVLGKRVALKVLSVALRADPAARRRLVREARAAAAVDHPNVVRVHDVDMDHDPPYLVMEYVDGVSLQAAVSRYGAFAAGEAAAVGVEIAWGLAAAAAAGLVHRDVKPANLLVDRCGAVKILDLGIVRLSGEDTQLRGAAGDGADVILGTLDYLAPEQAIDSSTVDGRADLYALGATLYFLLAGHPPFPSLDVRHKLASKLYTDPPPIHRLRPDVDPDLSAAVHSLLVRDPAARCPSAAAAAAALAPFAVVPADFPARLFRANRPSSGDPARDHSSLPDTERLRKSSAGHRSPIDAPAGEAGDAAPATDIQTKGPTEMEMTALPAQPAPPVAGMRLLADQERGAVRTLALALGAALLAALAAAAMFALRG